MIVRRFRLVAVDSGGKVTAAYIGDGAAKADAAFDKENANPKNDCVRLIIYPNASRTGYPSQEKRQGIANLNSRRVGILTEIEASTSAIKTAKEASDAAGADLKKAQDGHDKLLSHLKLVQAGKAQPIFGPESVKGAMTQYKALEDRAARKLGVLQAAAERLDKAQASLKEFDAANPEVKVAAEKAAADEAAAEEARTKQAAESRDKQLAGLTASEKSKAALAAK